MAENTPVSLRNQVMYCVYVRNHTPEGTFKALEQDLLRIKTLGADIIWLMPIYPCGKEARKGTLGSPYAIQDYRKINPEYGTMDDFRRLVDAIHELDMKCIIDVVYNHTSPDSVLAQQHPEYFYKKPDGLMGNRVGEWTDIVDLDYNNSELQSYQIETLKQWAVLVDGFRCDVASLVPVSFWKKARTECSTVKPNLIWLAESVHVQFVRGMRAAGAHAWSDGELYQAFDITYDYDIWEQYEQFLNGTLPLSGYTNYLRLQDGLYPENYVKLRCLENHDQRRICSYTTDPLRLQSLTAFLYFQKGTTLLYGGQEFAQTHTPSLFDKDTVTRTSGSLLPHLMQRLYQIKHTEIFATGSYELEAFDESGTLVIYYRDRNRIAVGIFPLTGKAASVPVQIANGAYSNEIYNEQVSVTNSAVSTDGRPIILFCDA